EYFWYGFMNTAPQVEVLKWFEIPVGVEKENDLIPEAYNLSQNFPNPFNPSTVISYQLPVSGLVSLKVYDILGSEVATLVNEYRSAGKYNVEFHSHSGNVRNLASGIYFYSLQAGSFLETKKMLLIK
ncbi:MAG: T9SS type A sorting domain-containing protein, partial [Ignavibacteriaceae bacterium]|nr:T9SS type A sorting domain-containing protein [Ignavibacteriaceae bacterium]